MKVALQIFININLSLALWTQQSQAYQYCDVHMKLKSGKINTDLDIEDHHSEVSVRISGRRSHYPHWRTNNVNFSFSIEDNLINQTVYVHKGFTERRLTINEMSGSDNYDLSFNVYDVDYTQKLIRSCRSKVSLNYLWEHVDHDKKGIIPIDCIQNDSDLKVNLNIEFKLEGRNCTQPLKREQRDPTKYNYELDNNDEILIKAFK